jgi:hypothetical protein
VALLNSFLGISEDFGEKVVMYREEFSVIENSGGESANMDISFRSFAELATQCLGDLELGG